jgi:perosamine synthetase
MTKIPIFNTFVHASAIGEVSNVLRTTFLSEGKLVQQFEKALHDEFGLSHPVAVNSGTTALHLALDVAGIQEGDEVILPAQTFVATGLVILQQKATPVFADIDYSTGNISVDSIRSKITNKTKAIIPVHWGGYPCDMDEITSLANANGIVVIEDAAHALGATYKTKPIGSISDFTCFSFQAIKHLTTGDGGSIAFTNEQNSKKAVVRRWFGIDRANSTLSILGERQYNIESLGYKYHLNDYAAALGLSNMQGFAARMDHRRMLAQIYDQGLASVPGLSVFNYLGDRSSAYWLYGMHVEKRDNFIRCLDEKGIATSVIHQRIDRNSIFGGLNHLPEQGRFDNSQIHIPIHDAVSLEQAEYIISVIKNGW